MAQCSCWWIWSVFYQLDDSRILLSACIVMQFVLCNKRMFFRINFLSKFTKIRNIEGLKPYFLCKRRFVLLFIVRKMFVFHKENADQLNWGFYWFELKHFDGCKSVHIWPEWDVRMRCNKRMFFWVNFPSKFTKILNIEGVKPYFLCKWRFILQNGSYSQENVLIS